MRHGRFVAAAPLPNRCFSPGIQLSPPHLVVGSSHASLVGNVVLGAQGAHDGSHVGGRVAAAEADELAHAAALLLEGQVGAPNDGAGVLSGPGTGRALVVEGGEALELSVCEEPKVQNGAGEVWMDSARGELHERREGEGHLMELVRQSRVPKGEAVEAGGWM